MGAKVKVNKALYDKIKKEAKEPKNDKKVMKKYDIGQTTVRAIRNSSSYTNFVSKTRGRNVKSEKKTEAPTSQERAFAAWYCVCGIIVLAAIATVFIIARWLIGVLFGV